MYMRETARKGFPRVAAAITALTGIVSGCGSPDTGTLPHGRLEVGALIGVANAPATKSVLPPDTFWGIHSAPYSTCSLHGKDAAAPTQALRVFGDARGIVHFYGPAAIPENVLVLDCFANDGTALAPQSLGATNLISAPLLNSTPQSGRVRPAVSGDPMTVTADALSAGGYPPRPDPNAESAAYTNWLKMVSKPVTIIDSQGVQVPGQRNPSITVQTISALNWAGATLDESHFNQTSTVYNQAMGYFTIPNVTSHGYPNAAEYLKSSIWLGLDGGEPNYHDDTVEQGGVEMDANTSCVGSNCVATASYYPWIEWAPDYAVALPNFVVYPGNYYYARAWIGDANGTINAAGGNV